VTSLTAMTTLIAGEPRFVPPMLHVDFTDTDTNATYSVKMDAEGNFIHDYGEAVSVALEAWERTALHPNGRPIVEDWKDRLVVLSARQKIAG
jgi:hypothetical protein